MFGTRTAAEGNKSKGKRRVGGKANVVADALSKESCMVAGIKVEEEIIRDLERLGIELLEAQKEDSEIWTIVENLDKQVEFRLDDDNVLWQDTRLVVPNDATLREALLTEAHSSPFSVHLESLGNQAQVQYCLLSPDRRSEQAYYSDTGGHVTFMCIRVDRQLG
nr:hypothetical protein [Tanacetum cinerariifolium]